jgi:hypothetical protein
MTIHICPHCNQRFTVDPNCEDFEHECNSNNVTLDNEDVVVIGDWIDYSGDGKENNIFMQGKENKLFGTRAAIEGEVVHLLTDRGKRASTRRQRPHLQFINLEGDDCQNGKNN